MNIKEEVKKTTEDLYGELSRYIERERWFLKEINRSDKALDLACEYIINYDSGCQSTKENLKRIFSLRAREKNK